MVDVDPSIQSIEWSLVALHNAGHFHLDPYVVKHYLNCLGVIKKKIIKKKRKEKKNNFPHKIYDSNLFWNIFCNWQIKRET